MPDRWVAFDLDDTLHAFRLASRQAVDAVFDRACRNPSLDRAALLRRYEELAGEDSRQAFVERMDSEGFRSRRFSRTFADPSGPLPAEATRELLAIYRQTLERNLGLLPGAREVLEAAKASSLGVAVITEAPQDAQEWTLTKLGLAPLVDLLVTSNRWGQGKTQGLFQTARRLMGLSPDEQALFFGDSVRSDIWPALEAGFRPILVTADPAGDDAEAVRRKGLTVLANLHDAIPIVRNFAR